MTKRLTMNQPELINTIVDSLGESFTTNDLVEWCLQENYSVQTVKRNLKEFKFGRNQYKLVKIQPTQQLSSGVRHIEHQTENLVPQIDPNYVPFGNFKDVKKIIESGLFYPLFITGLSGNGKTMSVEQACAKLKREMIRVNLTTETSEDDLIGGMRLSSSNGDTETVWSDGPVVQAMKRGAILLLDEIDLASNKIMCLQSVLEGKGLYLKKINQYVEPKTGFNIIATANTKGRGDESGKFMFTNNLNEAFLERFAFTFEQEYPTQKVELNILSKVARSLGLENCDKQLQELTTWSDVIRKTFVDGGIDDLITTRRLVYIVKAYCIWHDMKKAIQLTVNRFDEETKSVFLELYSKITDTTETQESNFEPQADNL